MISEAGVALGRLAEDGRHDRDDVRLGGRHGWRRRLGSRRRLDRRLGSRRRDDGSLAAPRLRDHVERRARATDVVADASLCDPDVTLHPRRAGVGAAPATGRDGHVGDGDGLVARLGLEETAGSRDADLRSLGAVELTVTDVLRVGAGGAEPELDLATEILDVLQLARVGHVEGAVPVVREDGGARGVVPLGVLGQVDARRRGLVGVGVHVGPLGDGAFGEGEALRRVGVALLVASLAPLRADVVHADDDRRGDGVVVRTVDDGLDRLGRRRRDDRRRVGVALLHDERDRAGQRLADGGDVGDGTGAVTVVAGWQG